MKKRTILALGATFSLAASAPVVMSPQEAQAATATLLARADANCRLPQDRQRLTQIFSTQQPHALRLLARRNMTVCLDPRVGPLPKTGTDRQVAEYRRYFDNYELPYAGDYAARPRLFNTLADMSRDTLLEKAAYVIRHFGEERNISDTPAMREARGAAILQNPNPAAQDAVGVAIITGQTP